MSNVFRLLAIGALLLSCAGPESECPEGTIERELFASRVMTEEDGTQCVSSEDNFSLGEFCFDEMQFGEEVCEYSDGDAWVVVEPHNERAVGELEEQGFQRLDTPLPTCPD